MALGGALWLLAALWSLACAFALGFAAAALAWRHSARAGSASAARGEAARLLAGAPAGSSAAAGHRGAVGALLASAERKELPSWILYPAAERAAWLNALLARMWPRIDPGVSSFIMETANETLEASRPALLTSLELEECTLGSLAPAVGGVRFEETPDAAEAVLDMDVKWAGNAKFKLVARLRSFVGRLSVTLKDVRVYAPAVRIVLAPFLPVFPGIGAVHVSLVQQPEIDFKVTLAGSDVMRVPGLMGAIRSTVATAIESQLLWPRQITVPLVGNYATYAAGRAASGLLLLKVKRGKNLPATDLHGKIDPFVFAWTDPAHKVQTSFLVDTDQPVWDEFLQVVVGDPELDQVRLQLWDHEDDSDERLVAQTSMELNDLEPGVVKAKTLPLRAIEKFRAASKGHPSLEVEALYVPLESDDFDLYEDQGAGSEAQGEDGARVPLVDLGAPATLEMASSLTPQFIQRVKGMGLEEGKETGAEFLEKVMWELQEEQARGGGEGGAAPAGRTVDARDVSLLGTLADTIGEAVARAMGMAAEKGAASGGAAANGAAAAAARAEAQAAAPAETAPPAKKSPSSLKVALPLDWTIPPGTELVITLRSISGLDQLNAGSKLRLLVRAGDKSRVVEGLVRNGRERGADVDVDESIILQGIDPDTADTVKINLLAGGTLVTRAVNQVNGCLMRERPAETYARKGESVGIARIDISDLVGSMAGKMPLTDYRVTGQVAENGAVPTIAVSMRWTRSATIKRLRMRLAHAVATNLRKS